MAVTLEEGRILKETCGISTKQVSQFFTKSMKIPQFSDARNCGMPADEGSQKRELPEKHWKTPLFLQSIPNEFFTQRISTSFRHI
jgi:hypothetical protein